MKIGIISIHYGVNFGSALQAYALPHYLETHYENVKTEIINYIPQRYLFRNKYHFNPKQGLKKTIGWTARSLQFFINDIHYVQFLNKHTNISPKLYDMETAKIRYHDYDLLIAGSDQIWNSDYNQGYDPMYYLDFASDSTKKISYAASCGKDSFEQEEWNKMMQSLESFDAISLREYSMKDTMKNAGVSCQFVLDPTFLLSSQEWQQLEKKEFINEPFLLIYLLDVEGSDIIEYAKKIAEERNLKTVLIANGPTYKKYNVDYVMWNKTPDSYIWLFRNASFVVTNSFHGTSFSINLEKQFIVLKREKYNSRIDSILYVMGLEDRCVFVNERVSFEDINYDIVNEKKNKLIQQSKDFLDKEIRNEY